MAQSYESVAGRSNLDADSGFVESRLGVRQGERPTKRVLHTRQEQSGGSQRLVCIRPLADDLTYASRFLKNWTTPIYTETMRSNYNSKHCAFGVGRRSSERYTMRKAVKSSREKGISESQQLLVLHIYLRQCRPPMKLFSHFSQRQAMAADGAHRDTIRRALGATGKLVGRSKQNENREAGSRKCSMLNR